MLVPSIILGLIAIALVGVGYHRGGGEHVQGLKIALNLTVRILPLLLFAFIVAGMIQVLIPKELLSRWVGAESGIRGILLGAVAGGLAPGGPYVSMPIAAGLLRAGASVGTMVAFITGWSIWAINRLPMEIGILGWKFTLVRMVSTITFPILAGFIAQLLFAGVKL
jgi:uncharacterized membrane protein YraQ (UPF0718 family)